MRRYFSQTKLLPSNNFQDLGLIHKTSTYLPPFDNGQLLPVSFPIANAGLNNEAEARKLFRHCYPLHPLTLLILPILCQKAAQNERTLFSYLGSGEPFGLRQRLGKMCLGEWVEPWELYDYFMLNPAGGFSDPLTQHRWSEVATALERFDADPTSPAAHLLKTIGLLNLIGAQRGLKASRTVGRCCGDCLAMPPTRY